MRAFTLDSIDAPPALRDDLPEPEPGAGELLVRVHASSVNPIDNFIAAGGMNGMVEHEFPIVLGRDFSGVVAQKGPGADRYELGERVFGFLLHANPGVHEGSWAEYIAVPEDNFVSPSPGALHLDQAGAVPVTAITALAAFDAVAPAADETVFVVGATGGVGSMFVQLAAAAGANVIAPGLPEDADYLRGIGVELVVDRSADVAAAVRKAHPDGVDCIVDLVSREADAALLKHGGRLASPLGAAGDGAGRFNVMAEPAPAKLQRVAGLFDAGTLRVSIARTYPLAEAGEALGALASDHIQGKIALTIL